MNGDASDTDGGDGVAAGESWSNDFSPAQTLFFGAIMVVVGFVGLAMTWLSVATIVRGSATRATFAAGLFGLATTAYAAYELTHL